MKNLKKKIKRSDTAVKITGKIDIQTFLNELFFNN